MDFKFFRYFGYFMMLMLLGGCFVGPVDNEATPTELTQTSEEQNDAGSGSDVSNDLTSPFVVDYGTFSGVLDPSDAGDAFGVKENPGDHISVEVTPSEGLDVTLKIAYYSEDYSDDTSNETGLGGREIISFTDDAASQSKKFGILVSGVGGQRGTYTLKVTKTHQNDFNTGMDAPGENGDEAGTLPILVAGVFTGNYLGSGDETDDFTIKLQPGQTINITATPDSSLDIGFVAVVCFTGGPCTLYDYPDVNTGFKGEVETSNYLNDSASQLLYKFGVAKVGKTSGTYKMTVTIN